MAYDAARAQVVMFGGLRRGLTYSSDTWTWNGTDWTRQLPTHVPSPREDEGLAYDAARSQVVLFGGITSAFVDETWLWNGTDWTQLTPAHSPSPRWQMGMTYDAAQIQVVLFGGNDATDALADTWTWNGSEWTHRTGPGAPSPRGGVAMAYDDTHSVVVLFGGYQQPSYLGDTWTRNGSRWAIPLPAAAILIPNTGSPGTPVQVQGTGFGALEKVVLSFVDSIAGTTKLKTVETDATGAFTTQATIPLTATAGAQRVEAKATASQQAPQPTFTVT